MVLYWSIEMGDFFVIVVCIDGVDWSKLFKVFCNRIFLDYYDFIERKNWEERLIKYFKLFLLDKNLEKKNLEKIYFLLCNVSEV